MKWTLSSSFSFRLLTLLERKFNVKKKYAKFSDKFNTSVVDVSIFIAILVVVFFITLPLFGISKLIFGAVFFSLALYSIYIIFPKRNFFDKN